MSSSSSSSSPSSILRTLPSLRPVARSHTPPLSPVALPSSEQKNYLCPGSFPSSAANSPCTPTPPSSLPSSSSDEPAVPHDQVAKPHAQPHAKTHTQSPVQTHAKTHAQPPAQPPAKTYAQPPVQPPAQPQQPPAETYEFEERYTLHADRLRSELPRSVNTLRSPPPSFTQSRRSKHTKLTSPPASPAPAPDVPCQTLLKALVSEARRPPPALSLSLSPTVPAPLTLSHAHMASIATSLRNEAVMAPPETPATARLLGGLKSPCFYHKRFDKTVNVERVLEEMTAGGFGPSGGPSDSSNGGDDVRAPSRLMQTALGVREVARQLQRRTCHMHVRSIMIVTKARDHALVGLTRELALWLMDTPRYGQSHGVVVYVDAKLRQSRRFAAPALLAAHPHLAGQLRYWTPALCWRAPETFDLVLTLGGDGTVLFTSWLFQRIVPPVLSFALGSLGFLTAFGFDAYRDTLAAVLDDGVRVNMRMRFTCTVYRAHGDTHVEKDQFEVLNELVIDRGPSPYVSNLELYGDNEPITVVQADGVIFSTPTGSTAYSLSAGGSLVHPDIPAILLTPICPHSLSFRPMLLNDSMLLRVCVPAGSRATAWCAFDGKGRLELCPGDFVTIAASQYPFPTVLSSSTEWIDGISRTLRWNSRAQQKAWASSKTATGPDGGKGDCSPGTSAGSGSGDDEDEDDDEKWDIDTDSVYDNEELDDGAADSAGGEGGARKGRNEDDSPVARTMALLGL